MSLRKGAIVSSSQKQKINTRSSTEAKVVPVNDMVGHIMWVRNFMEAQGIRVDEPVIFQDNQSAMLLEENGRESSGKRTRHMNIRYFFYKGPGKKGDIDIKYCPTEVMIDDI